MLEFIAEPYHLPIKLIMFSSYTENTVVIGLLQRKMVWVVPHGLIWYLVLPASHQCEIGLMAQSVSTCHHAASYCPDTLPEVQ